MDNKKTRRTRQYFEVYEKSAIAVPVRAIHPEITHLTLSVWLDRNVFFPGICFFFSFWHYFCLNFVLRTFLR
jgi:hypothetical protein